METQQVYRYAKHLQCAMCDDDDVNHIIIIDFVFMVFFIKNQKASPGADLGMIITYRFLILFISP